MKELIRLTATALVEKLREGEISPFDCLDALEERISEVDEEVNALPTLCFDHARKHAENIMKMSADQRGLLAGLPVAIKDLCDVAGVRSTQGSPIFANRIPDTSDILVDHLEAAGGVVYAKSNTPEFGAGANTFNEVFGRTLNPWNTSRSAAGSSGGAAVALATGTAWLAHGSDLGGSLRNPASFCGIVGMRPSPGRVARTPDACISDLLSVDGPMARNVDDVALFLDAMSGEEPGDPVSLPAIPGRFQEAARSGWRPNRIAVSKDLGITPVDGEVADIVMSAAMRLEDGGAVVEEAHPDLSEAHECFQTLRALSYATEKKALLENHRNMLKPEVVWNIEKGMKLTAADIAKAENQRHAMFRRMGTFFETYDLLITPATIVAPYPVEQRYVESCSGHRFSNYIEWLAIAFAITNVACPAISIPAGFTKEILPVGLQVVASARADGRVIAGAKWIESVLGLQPLTPIDPRPGS